MIDDGLRSDYKAREKLYIGKHVLCTKILSLGLFTWFGE